MTTHTEAREAVAREIVLGAGVEPMAVARSILARLGELGYVQRDRLLSDEAVEAAAKAVWPYIGCEPCEPSRHKIPWSGHSTAANKLEKDFARQAVQAAIAAAIAKAGESA